MATSQTTNLHLVKPDYTEIGDVDVINDNMDIIDGAVGNINTSLGGKKTTQTAKSDPTASGTSLTFIDTVTQNTNGEITATKKTVKDMVGASASAAGAHGLVPQPAAGNNTKFLRGDGTWQTPQDTTYGAASSSALGLIKTGYTASGKNYPVALDGNNKAYVNVPWSDTTYGEASSNAYGLIKTGYSASGKNYPVALSGGKAYVNVPWTDTTYGEASSSAYGLIKTGYTASGKNYPVALSSGKAYVNVPWTDTNTWRGYQIKEYNKSCDSIPANGVLTLTATELGLSTPTGYTPAAILKFNTASSLVVPTLIDPTATGSINAVGLKNVSTTQASAPYLMLKILYLQT